MTAAMAKWWVTELHLRVVHRAVQLHGGYGYMKEYSVARDFMDSRAGTIYGGATEVMKRSSVADSCATDMADGLGPA